MADDWYYARKGERFGPVPWAKVRALAEQGWLMPGDLVWTPDMSDWQPAASVKGLFKNSLVESLGAAVDGVIPGIRPVPADPDSTAAGSRGRGSESPFGPDFFEHLAPRHLVAACGAFVAALGIAFTAISPSSLGLAFTLGGLALAAAGMYAEVGTLLAQAVANIATARKEAAERRLEMRRLAVEQKKLEVEAARLAAEKDARERPVPMAPPPVPPAEPVAARPMPQAAADEPRLVPADHYGPGEHVTIVGLSAGALVADEELRRRVAEVAGTRATFGFLPFEDLDQSVRDDVAALRTSPYFPPEYEVLGLTYDVRTGRLEVVE
ncbi:MAG: GYF domain-containing protein [Enhydrobacter sp.]